MNQEEIKTKKSTQCFFDGCNEPTSGHKQINASNIVERLLLCREHLHLVKDIDSFNAEDAMKFKKLMDGIA